MKLYYAFLACCLAATQFAAAQSNLVIFSPDGLKFYLLLNGEQQNQTAKANIKITGLTDPALKAKIIFEDNTMANIDQTVYFNQDEPNTEYAYQIKNKKGKYKLGYFSVKPIAEVKPNPTQQVIIYGQPETVTTVVTTTTTTNANPTPAPVVVNTTTNTTNTTVTNSNTTTNPQTITKPNTGNVNVNVNANDNNGNNNNDNFNMSINVGGNPDNPNFNMNVNVNENGNNGNPNNGNPNNDNFNMNVNVTDPNNGNPNVNTNVNTNANTNVNTNVNTNTSTTTSTTTTTSSVTTRPAEVVVPAAKNKCAVSMSNDQASKAAAKVKATAFDSDQLKAAKTAVEKNCATAAQIKQIAKEMKYEDSKTTFLKYAYEYCTDQANYDEILDVLKHGSDREAVEKIMK